MRFKPEIKLRLPLKPYLIKGLFETEVKCIPFHENLTHGYLSSIQLYDSKRWNSAIERSESSDVYSWRDGESSFFLPNGNQRENAWLQNESKKINRVFLSDCTPRTIFSSNDKLVENQYHYYPVHSFTAWVKEFRMLGFINKIKNIEDNLSRLSLQEIAVWLQVINSDILSAIEKDSPVVKIRTVKK
jgi:hypothetical protein